MSPVYEEPRQRADLRPPDRVQPQPAAGRSVTAGVTGDDVAVMLLVDLQPGSSWWGFSRLVRGASALRGTRGLHFAKVLGSGHDGGFGLRPSTTRQGLFAVFEGEAAADAYLADSPVLQGYRRRAREVCTLKLRAYSCRGSWGGQSLRVSAMAPGSGPVAALTRASIRPLKAWQFWPLATPAQRSLEGASGCELATGLGEAPLLRQATFSVWSGVDAMDGYARQGAHLQAIRNSAQGDYFSESMFVRFVPLSIRGSWKGRNFD